MKCIINISTLDDRFPKIYILFTYNVDFALLTFSQKLTLSETTLENVLSRNVDMSLHSILYMENVAADSTKERIHLRKFYLEKNGVVTIRFSPSIHTFQCCGIIYIYMYILYNAIYYLQNFDIWPVFKILCKFCVLCFLKAILQNSINTMMPFSENQFNFRNFADIVAETLDKQLYRMYNTQFSILSRYCYHGHFVI